MSSYLNNISTTTIDKLSICPVIGIPVGCVTALSNFTKTVEDLGKITIAAYRCRQTSPTTIDVTKVKLAAAYSQAKQDFWQHLTFIVIGIIRVVPIVGALMTWAYNARQANQLIKAGEEACKTENYELAIKLYEQTVSLNGSVDTMLKISILYRDQTIPGKTKEQSDKLHFQWAQRAANLGNAVALNQLGVCYSDGLGISKSDEMAFTYYQRAALKGNSDAQYNFGCMLLTRGNKLVEAGDKEKHQKLFDEGISWLSKSAAQGDIDALDLFGKYSYNGLFGVTKSFKDAFNYWKQAADLGHPQSQLNIANMFSAGDGVDKSEEQAVIWYNKAADQGDKSALHRLGSYSYNGWFGVTKSFKDAFNYWKQAADLGHPLSQLEISTMFSSGDGYDNKGVQLLKGSEEAKKLAFEWCEKAAKNGNAAAQNLLGYYYSVGDGVNKSEEQAVVWYKKAADQGHKSALYKLGGYSYKGESGMTKSLKDAFNYWKKAADLGHPLSQLEISSMFQNGTGYDKDGIQLLKDSKEAMELALEWCDKAAKNGNNWAQLGLGNIFLKEGTPNSLELALKFFTLAANGGNAEAQCRVGFMHDEDRTRIGSLKSKETAELDLLAVQWYTKAANQNYATANFNLGRAHFKGKLGLNSSEKAQEYLEKGVALGSVASERLLALLYSEGKVIKDGKALSKDSDEAKQEAVKFIRRAIDNPNVNPIITIIKAKAEMNLAEFYEQGYGVKKSSIEAYKLYESAAEKGHELAKAKLKELDGYRPRLQRWFSRVASGG